MRRAAIATTGVALALAACSGSVSPQASRSTTAVNSLSVVRAAAAKATAARTVRFAMHLTTSPRGQAFTMSMTGAADLVRRVGSFNGSLATPGLPDGSSDLSAVFTPTAFYVRLPILGAVLRGKNWLKVDFAGLSKYADADIGQLIQQAQQTDPTAYLQMLAAAGGVRVVGHDNVNGVRTTHYAGTVPLAHLTNSLSPKVRQLLANLAKQAHVNALGIDAWIADDGLPRRIRTTMTSAFTGQATVDVTMSDYGKPVSITIPPSADVVDLSSAHLAG